MENYDLEEQTSETEMETPETEESAELADGMRPEFKEAMDSYEEFYIDYCEFMKKCNEDPSDVQLIFESAEMLTKVAEMDEKFSAWDEGEMNNTELQHYIEVQARTLQKLAEVAG